MTNIPNILIIDDSEDYLRFLSLLLQNHYSQLTLRTATSGEEALELIAQEIPNLILLDAKMPGMSGFEVCEQLKNDPGLAPIPILMMSGVLTDHEHHHLGVESGADGYLNKPFQAEELLSQVDILLRAYRAEQALRNHRKDIEQSEQEHHNLKENEALFHMLFESSPEAILVITEDGRILKANTEAGDLLETSSKVLETQNILDLVAPSIREALAAELSALICGQTGSISAERLYSKSGKEVPIEMKARPIEFRNGPAMLLYISDITDRKRIEGGLQAIAKTVSESTGFGFFFALVQHLAEALNIRGVLLAERERTQREMLNVISACVDGEIIDGFTFSATGGPEADLLESSQMLYLPENAIQQYPQSVSLNRWNSNMLMGVPLKNAEGNPIGVLIVFGDKGLTDPKQAKQILQIFGARAAAEIERKRAVEDLWESEEWHRSITEDVLDAASLGLILTDTQGQIAWNNSSATTLLNQKKDSIAHRNFKEVLTEAASLFEEPQEFVSTIDAMRKEQLPQDRSEFRMRSPDEEARWLEWRCQPVSRGLYAGGRITYLEDISRQKRAESQLSQLAQAVEQAAESFVITNTSGHIEYVNPAFESITGYTRQQATGAHTRLLKSGKHDKEFYSELWSTISAGQVWQGKFINKKADQSLYETESIISPIRDLKGEIVNYVAVSRDLSREVELEGQLRQAQKMEGLGRLAGGIAHDFNNLLTSILGFSRLARDQMPPDHPAIEDLSEVINAGDRAVRLTRQLLTFGRKQKVQMDAVDLNSAVLNMDQLLRRTLGEHIELVTLLEEDIGTIESDTGQIEQVVMNLAVNARDAMEKGGKITIRTRNVTILKPQAMRFSKLPVGSYVLLCVEDTGEGMSSEVLDHAFEPFFTTKKKDKGTGLGLSTVYGIVQQNNAHIDVITSDQGTQFQIFFPLSNVRGTREGNPQKKILRGGSEHILVVEDEESVRSLTVRMLQALGYSTATAMHGEDGLRLFRQSTKNFDMVISDVIMPQMGGPEMANHILKEKPDTPIMFMSGYMEDAVDEHHDLMHSCPLLRKPFTQQSLGLMVRDVLDDAQKTDTP